MFKIIHNKIYLTKGDTARFSISAVDYNLNSSVDTIYFIVTDAPEIVEISDLGSNTSNYVFYKQGVNIVINPSDTEDLTRDTYYYQVRVILGGSGDTNTIIEPEEFFITPVKR